MERGNMKTKFEFELKHYPEEAPKHNDEIVVFVNYYDYTQPFKFKKYNVRYPSVENPEQYNESYFECCSYNSNHIVTGKYHKKFYWAYYSHVHNELIKMK
tara:strand:- start:297 stop:596 length:300 start_codon:yes stop_codon:yes gene_type:complete